ncbi:MAG: YicC family protein [Sneathiella sp.]|nr:YicC family protein [Sneathiella sp.]
MTLRSMTGFARVSGAQAEHSWLWEIKSVNGRGLEIRSRLPGGFDRVEESARKLIKSRLHRGTVNLHLQLSQGGVKSSYQVNQKFLGELLALAHSLVEAGNAEPARIDGMMALKGVIEQGDRELIDDTEQKALEDELAASLKEALGKLEAAREEEGRQLEPVLTSQIDEIASLIEKASSSAALRPENIRKRMKNQVDILLSNKTTFDEGRLEQELAILVTKADVSEELDRLSGHVATVRELLQSSGNDAMGRRLDFICQEFNREANTLCSKAGDKELTQIGLDLKVVVDRLREQVQNIE